MAAFGLIASALSAQSADVVIEYLPFTITAPGTYVLTGNLTFDSYTNGNAISISPSTQGAVDLDLKGYTITGPGGQTTGVAIALQNSKYPILVRNGTFKNFGYGVVVEPGTSASTYLHDITVDKIVFSITSDPSNVYSTGVSFYQVSSSAVTNCTFNGGVYGIVDANTAGNNSYTNDTFLGTSQVLSVTGPDIGSFAPYAPTPIILNHCGFEVHGLPGDPSKK